MKKTDNKRIDDILVSAREQLEQFGALHDEGCPCNMEDPDFCDCGTMDALENEVRVALEALDKYWITNLEAHRPYCRPAGNKILTKIKRNLPIANPAAHEDKEKPAQIS